MSHYTRTGKLPTGTSIAIGVRTNPKCKICCHPKRLEIEALMVRQMNCEYNEDGTRLSRRCIVELALEKWDFSITQENLQIHGAKHFQYQKSLSRMTAQLEGQSSRMLELAVATAAVGRIDRKALLAEFITFGFGVIRDTDGAAITPDLLLKAIDLDRKEGEVGVADVWRSAAGSLQINVNVNTKKASVIPECDILEVEVEAEADEESE